MAIWPLLIRIAIIKNSISLFLVKPVSRHVVRYGRGIPGFYPVCRTLTQGFYNTRNLITKGKTPPLTRREVEDTGGKVLTWLGLTGTITCGYLWAESFRRSRKRERDQKLRYPPGYPRDPTL